MDYSFVKDLAPVVAVSVIWAYVFVKYSSGSEKAHEEKTRAFLGSLEKKDAMFQTMTIDHFSKQTVILEKVTGILEKMDGKLDTRIDFVRKKK